MDLTADMWLFASPRRESWQIRDLVPSDMNWLDDEEYSPYAGGDAPSTTPPSGTWYHVSPQPFTVGARIVPAGGESPDPDFYEEFEQEYGQPTNRQSYVWIAQNLGAAVDWAASLRCPYIYKVHPKSTPQPWNFDGGNGYVCDSAVVESLFSSTGGASEGISQMDPYRPEKAWLFTAAEPGGKLPYTPSEFGYEWWSNGDGSYYAESRDALVTLTLDTQVGGRQVGWVAEDDMGVVERGNFSGMTDLSNLDSICYQGDRLLAQFDTRPAIPPKGFGYDKGYSEDFPNSYPSPDFRY